MNESKTNPVIRRLLMAAIAGVLSAQLAAHEGSAHRAATMSGPPVDYANAEQHAFGKASDPGTAARVITVGMSDKMRFEPAVMEVKQGEPLRFHIENHGQLMHEMVIGTREALEQHAELMKKFPGMEHAEPYMAHVPPEASGVIGWTFTQPGEYFYACLLPGHYEAGMIGRVVVR